MNSKPGGDMQNSIKIDVFGRHVQAIKTAEGWQMYYLSSDGKRRPAENLRVPPFLTATELAAYLADLCHEWATDGHPEVRRVD